ncbi:hypothetical protein H6F89_01010 [Cyanobacteria bacterium FACHB-63]|nr:hypothetical protein [Cyanobacteria bacterium FACHB-63]
MIPNFLRTSAVVFVSSAALALSAAAPGSALTTFSGSLGLPDPTWVRPVPNEVNDGNPATNGLAGGNGGYYYDVQSFTVSNAGAYRIVVNSTSNLNPLVVLYQGAFNPNSQYTNVFRANGSLSGSATQAGFNSLSLTPGTYNLVITSNPSIGANAALPNTGSIGAYTGEVTAVPFAFSPLPGLAVAWAARGARRRIAAKKEVLAKA